MQAVTEIARELLGLGAGQRGTEPECMEEGALVDPAAALDDLAVHQVDLCDRAAKRDTAESQPDAERRTERHGHVVAPPIAQTPRRRRSDPSTTRKSTNSVIPAHRPVRPKPR